MLIKYLKHNNAYWQNSYSAPNVENVIFRLQGRVLKPKFKLPDINKQTTSLDFGCGQGAIVNYLQKIGYDAYGIDISKVDIEIAKKRYPHIADKFRLCKPDAYNVMMTKFTDGKKISLITGQQSLYYFDKNEFNILLKNFNNSLTSNGLIYASMMSTQHTYHKYSKKTKYEWLRESSFTGKRFKFSKYFNFHCKSKKDVRTNLKVSFTTALKRYSKTHLKEAFDYYNELPSTPTGLKTGTRRGDGWKHK